jgi:hypothetical protein
MSDEDDVCTEQKFEVVPLTYLAYGLRCSPSPHSKATHQHERLAPRVQLTMYCTSLRKRII